MPTSLGRIAARRAGVKAVVSGIRVAERGSRWHLWLDRLTQGWVDRYVCVSQSVAEFSASQGGLPPEKLVVIPNGIDLDKYPARQPADLAALGIRAGTPDRHVRRPPGAAKGRAVADRDGPGVAGKTARLRSPAGRRRPAAAPAGGRIARRRALPSGSISPAGDPTCPKSSPPATSWCCLRPGRGCPTWCWRRWPAAGRWWPRTWKACGNCSGPAAAEQTVRYWRYTSPYRQSS